MSERLTVLWDTRMGQSDDERLAEILANTRDGAYLSPSQATQLVELCLTRGREAREAWESFDEEVGTCNAALARAKRAEALLEDCRDTVALVLDCRDNEACTVCETALKVLAAALEDRDG